MTQDEFITSMRVLFRVWRGTENATEILTDVCDTIGSQCFGLRGLELRGLAVVCSQQDEEPPAPKTDAYQDYLVKSAKFCEALQDSFFAPKW